MAKGHKVPPNQLRLIFDWADKVFPENNPVSVIAVNACTCDDDCATCNEGNHHRCKYCQLGKK